MSKNEKVKAAQCAAVQMLGPAVCVVIMACLSLGPASAQAPATPAPPPAPATVTVIAPKQQELKQYIKLPGALIPDEQVSLCAKVAGYLSEISVDKGDPVKKDQVLATLSVPEMEPELALARAKLRAAESRLGKARASAALEAAVHQRLAKLHAAEPGAVTEEDTEEAAAKDEIAQAEVVAVEAELGVARAEVKRLETMLDYLVVRAPFDGTVTRRLADTGALIAAGSNAAPILEITRVEKLRLVFDLPERLTPFVKKGATLRYTLAALPGKQFEGTIARRTDALDPETRTMHAELDLDNSDGALAPGMYASIQIPLNGMPGISVVPSSALRTVEGRIYVFAAVEGVAKKLPVESLLDEGAEVAVSGELRPEMKIISNAPANLADGQPVKIKEGN